MAKTNLVDNVLTIEADKNEICGIVEVYKTKFIWVNLEHTCLYDLIDDNYNIAIQFYSNYEFDEINEDEMNYYDYHDSNCVFLNTECLSNIVNYFNEEFVHTQNFLHSICYNISAYVRSKQIENNIKITTFTL